MFKLQSLLTAAVLGWSAAAVLAFNGHQVTEGPLTVAIANIETVTRFDQPQTVQILLTNTDSTTLMVQLQLAGLVDECRVIGESQRRVELPAGEAASSSFQFAMGHGSRSALYPFHVNATFRHAGQEVSTHAVRIFESDFSTAEQTEQAQSGLPVNVVPASGALALASLKTHRLSWQWFERPLQYLPVGWEGSEANSSAHFNRGPAARGENRQALQTHPPFKGGPGTLFVEYRLKLPRTTPIELQFFNAIRDHSEKEPPSDGVTFRVWAAPSNVSSQSGSQSQSTAPALPAWAEAEKLFERHTDSKRWLDGKADLSKYAGQEILLRLESHPGPQRNTTCDSGFWGDPVVVAGPRPPLLSPEEKSQQLARARAAVAGGRSTDTNTFVFQLAEGNRAVVIPGPNGVADAALAFGTGKQVVVFEGVNVALFDQTVGSWPAGVVVEKVEASRDSSGRLRMLHRIRLNEAAYDLLAEFWPEQAGLRMKLSSAARITDLSLRRTDCKASRVFYGHGYCLVDPKRFQAGGGGHNLSTSHVGMEFDTGIALLTACDTPPDNFQVDGAEHLYALHTHPDTTFTFVPSVKGAFDCAFNYRPLYDKQAAPAFTRKAGRFVFDLWGGRYAEDAARLQRCFDYGLTNSLVLMHVWQRWGYDYRLPDIFPPLPSLGTLEELRDLGRVCTQAGALWGLHDNYIDIYPDATGFSYEHVTFTPDDRPRKAWLNEGRQAQSYQFRPDHVGPFLERNLKLIEPALKPSASFVDVWTSINAFDYFDCQGQFHSKMETLRCWGEGFARLRDTFGNAPTSSEAGSDQLIGWLDGADCQFLQIGPRGERFHVVAPCQDWERVPWFDAVNHRRFSLHGVGYSSRYEGGRSRDLHGIESDDYLSAELLTGHALMIDLPGLVRGAVRKYWLAQEFVESVALEDIASVEFVGSDIHRLSIGWNSGARVYVNRGPNDWVVAGHTLPPYGYFAKNGAIESSIERLDGVVVEQSRGQQGFYVNGRGFNPRAPLAIQPEAESIEYAGGRNFRLVVNWQADSPAPKDLNVFYHFNRPTPGRYTDTEFHGGGQPTPPTSQWSGRLTTGRDWTVSIPEGMPLGEYEVLVGLYDAAGRAGRYRLLGDEDSARRYRIGTLFVEGTVANGKTNVTGVRLEKPQVKPAVATQLLANRTPINFDVAATTGAFRVQRQEQSVLLVPLPDGNDFEVNLNLERLFGRPIRARSLQAVDATKASRRDVPFKADPKAVQFTACKEDFGYRLEVE